MRCPFFHPLTVQKTEHGFHRIVTAGDDLLDAQAELRDRRSRTSFGQQSPTFKRSAHGGKIVDLRITVR